MSVPLARARRALLWVAFALLVGNLAAIGVRATRSDAVAAPPTTDGVVTTTTAPADSPVVTGHQTRTFAVGPSIRLPIPQPAPADPYAPEPEIQIGRLQVPAIGLDTILYEGVSLTSIDRGPSHWPGTAVPGQLGNVVVAGHRVTHTRPFRDLDELGPGDQAIFTTPDGTFTYDYVRTEIVDPDRTDIVGQTVDYTATFFACHPPGSARSRIVVHWRLANAPPLPTGAGSITVVRP